ncbi:MAG: CBS domain-containing protein [Cyclobacteriaceae bacterium]|jgi:CBS domain-containing protein|nr:CBS domain-containing protein [Cyclobacteriaceae bacterium]MDH4297903.1 CBS domain-containing protein [Cyclobacteriaceae bacterium]MDH5251562.1 CBS domain-containing protein [Cyclobacteriaceae bacterium]
MNFKPVFEKKNLHEANYESIEKYMVPLNQMITLRPDQPIREAIATILKNRISGAPVLDEQRRLVGNLSEKDCLQIIVDKARDKMVVENKKVSDYMSTKVFTISPTTNVVEAAIEFLSSPIRRYAVVEKGALIGEISRREILRAAQHIKSTSW